jgi:pyruvate dehydrogenase E2 component (dihydrolipoamide acetyltransferase)
MAEAYTTVPLSPMRKAIAARMSEAKQTIPHFRVTNDVEIDALISVRAELQMRNPDARLSLNDLLIKCCAGALLDTPAVNIQWAGSAIHQYHNADIAFVTALDAGGLTTPILRSADSKSVWDLSHEIKELTARARSNTLRMDEIVGGSFSISNLGMYQVDEFDAIINPPQCAILAIGTAKPRVVASAGNQTRVATVLRATLSVDHRAIDGATAATFLTALRERIERPTDLLSARNL